MKKRKRSLSEEKKSKSPRKTKSVSFKIYTKPSCHGSHYPILIHVSFLFFQNGYSPAKRLQQQHQECDEDCSAPQCKQPTGMEVIWIQCDGCDLWFHLTCVGLKKSQVKGLDNYTCVKCDPKKPKISDVEDGSSCDTVHNKF